jgi:hypothetical protein
MCVYVCVCFLNILPLLDHKRSFGRCSTSQLARERGSTHLHCNQRMGGRPEETREASSLFWMGCFCGKYVFLVILFGALFENFFKGFPGYDEYLLERACEFLHDMGMLFLAKRSIGNKKVSLVCVDIQWLAKVRKCLCVC